MKVLAEAPTYRCEHPQLDASVPVAGEGAAVSTHSFANSTGQRGKS